MNDQRANTDGASGDRRSSRAWLALAGAVALAVLTVAVFAPVRHFDFVDLDDPQYVFENPNVTGGLTWSGVRWAITTPHASFWIPAVWISYMADIEIFGQGPAGHHVSLALAYAAEGLAHAAIAAYQDALRLSPDLPIVHNDLGALLETSGRIEEAIGHFREALRLAPDFAVAHANLALALVKLDRYPEAITEFQAVLRLDPGNALARRALDTLVPRQPPD